MAQLKTPPKDFRPEDIAPVIIPIYRRVANGLIGAYGIKGERDCIFLSRTALTVAVREIINDIGILKIRRGYPRFSAGKIAGCIVFRLSRRMITHTSSDNLLANRTFLKINHQIAFFVGLKYIGVHYGHLEKSIRSEILFNLVCRHTNQETLGIVFDVISHANGQGA